jgi:hypothetical protein
MRNRLSIFVFLLLVLAHVATAQWKQNPSQTYTKEEAVILVNQLLVAITPDRPENAYMTPFMKEKIRWVYAEAASHRLNIAFVDNTKGKMGVRTVLMNSGRDNGVLFIQISANRLLELIRIQQHVAIGFNQMQKNTFALALVHEAVHLERPHDKPRPKVEFVREELRTCRKVDREAVIPLLKIGEPLDIDFHDIHSILGKCGNSQDCPAFQKYYVDDPGVALVLK